MRIFTIYQLVGRISSIRPYHVYIPGRSKVGFIFDNLPKMDQWAELRTPGRNLLDVVQSCVLSTFHLSAICIKIFHSLCGPLLEINFWQQVRPPPCLHLRIELFMIEDHFALTRWKLPGSRNLQLDYSL